MKQQKRPQHNARNFTAAFFAAAGLAAAAYVYLKRSGVDPKKTITAAGKGALSAGNILTGESKRAYADVRSAIIQELAGIGRKPTKRDVLHIIGTSMTVLQRRGKLTKEQLTALGGELKGEWDALQRDAVSNDSAIDDA